MKMKSKNAAIFPGTFDPITKGHISIIKQSLNIFDYLYVCIGKNYTKSNKTLFSEQERKMMIDQCLEIENLTSSVQVNIFSGLLYDFANELNVHNIIRGVRNANEFIRWHSLSKILNDNQINTIMIPSYCPEISSSILKEISYVSKDVNDLKKFTYDLVAEKVIEKIYKI